ncbi:hypothetical protein Q5H93_01610 [Hymenobacter sp. ASUV-10]|uniref:Uncharacterized protein n=1 Tax=Hymenobacter aranciens TaxID=3063996 RepID=A0ABT9B583_9BACT|nr:hypothetical protein [Hymenobacter sp. ASUV-10]MDO7873409.1 hypothetical protein [Hymenobacter sp. ASUV-10]
MKNYAFPWLSASMLAAILLPSSLLAQRLDAEKFCDVSGKAKRGYLSDVTVDNKAGKIDLLFCTKSTDKQVATQTYHFDTKYNLLGVDENSIPVEKVKGYRGENFSKNSVTLETSAPATGAGVVGMMGALEAFKNPAGTLLIRHRRTDYKWSWLGGGYRKKVKLLHTEKPKAESGAGYRLIDHVDDDANGGTLALVQENMKLSNMKAMKVGYHLLYFNDKAELTSDVYLDTDVAQTFVQMAPIGLDQDEEADDSQLPARDVAIMLAYTKGAGATKDKHPTTEYQYLRVSATGQVKEKIRVDSPVSAWLVSGFIPMNDGGVLAYGPANDDTKKHYAEALPDAKPGMTVEESFKAKNFQLGKIMNGQVAWITTTDLKEFEDKQKVPAGQKRTPDYTGKRFFVRQSMEAPNGDLLIGGQNFKMKGGNPGNSKFLDKMTGGDGNYKEPDHVYGDLLLFHFDKTGHLRAQYGVRRAENNATTSVAPNPQYFHPSVDGKSLYWNILEIDGWRTVNGLTEDGKMGGIFEPTMRETISYPSVTRISLADASIGAQKTFGVTKEGKYYVSNKYTTLPVGDENKQVVYFGENKSGKTLWFGQMPLE